jgi:integration host factor subunit beta
MTKTELIEKISEKHNMPKSKAEVIVNTVFDSMIEALENDGRIEIRGFGSFVNREYETRKGRNPKTGEIIQIPAKKLPFFKTGKDLKADLQKD